MTAIDRLESFARELEAGNFDSVSTYIAPEFFGSEPKPGEPTATERFAEITAAVGRAMPDMRISLERISEQDDGTLTARLGVTGTHTAPLWGSPGSGRPVEWKTPVTVRPVGDQFAVRFERRAVPGLIGVLRQFGLVNPPDEMDQPHAHPVSPPDFLLKVILTGQAADKRCLHLDDIRVTEPETRVCAPCFEEGVQWPALRMCLICGYVGCCDTSKNRHMLAHHAETGHPLVRSIRMDESWVWCYEDNAMFGGRVLGRTG